MSASLLPVLLALLGALSFGLSGLVAQLGLRHGDARLGSMISIGTTAALYWLLLPLALREAHWTLHLLLEFLAVFGAIGLVSPSVSLFCSFEGNRRLGPTVSSTVASTAPLFGAAAAVEVLGEQMTPGIATGTLGIVAGVMVLSWRGRRRRDAPLWAVLFPLAAAVVRGGSQAATKLGFSVAPAPLMGALITYNVSFLVVSLSWRLSARRAASELSGRAGLGLVRRFAHSGLRWFLVTGALNATGFASLYLALSRGDVVVVTPVVSTFPLFTFGFALLFRVERLSLRIALGVLLVVLGVVAVTHR